LLAIHSFLNSVQVRDRISATISTKEKTMTGTNFNLGRLIRGATPTTQQSTMFADGTTKRDIFRFTTGSLTENVNISTTGFGQVKDAFSLALFRDVNNNGSLDSFELAPSNRIRLSDSGRSPNEANESLNANLTQGTYFAEAKAFAQSSITYTLRAARAKTGSANPLTAPEISLGQISQDLRKTDRVNDSDTADNFAFTLDGSSSLDINVLELGNKKGDVNVRVVQDLDSDGFVDKNEVVVKGTSTLKGNLDTISGLKGAGDYILQVCQTSGNTGFEVNFNHSAA
jgi:hypothetical protein